MSLQHAIFQLYPTVPATLCFAAGIITGEQWTYTEWWLSAAVTAAIIAVILQRRHIRWQSATILMGFFSTGAFLSAQQQHCMSVSLPQDEITYEAVVITEAREHPQSWSADIAITSGCMQGKIIKAYFSKKRGVCPLPTECLTATSQLTLPDNNTGTSFDYALYLRRHGICATTFIAPWKYRPRGFSTESLPTATAISAKLRLLRTKAICEISGWGMPKDAESLIAGIALGHKNSISREMRDTYSQAGAAHVLALSGLHLGIIWALFGVLCVGRWRTAGTMVALLTIWAYVMFVGLPPSAVRAAIMLTVCSIATMSGRRGSSLNALAFAALIILMITPTAIHDLGFQLSFAAVAFILIFSQPLTEIVPAEWRQRHKFMDRLWQMCIISVIANLGTLPLVAHHFARIPMYVIATNLVAIPLVTIILWLFTACMLLMLLSAPAAVSGVAVTLLGATATCLNSSMDFIASLPYSSVNDVNISVFQTGVMYIGIIAVLRATVIILGTKELR